MHVLLLALNYYPDKLGNAPLMTGLAEGLVALGHRVTVVCAFPHHETGRVEAGYRRRLFKRESRRGVDIIRTYIYTPKGGGKIGKAATYASFTASALTAALAVRRPDVIFTPSPPLTLGLVDQLLGRLKGIPFVYNLQDLFPEAAIRLGVLTNPAVIAGLERLEQHVYARAAHLSVISEGFRRFLIERGVPPRKITVIPNYTDAEFIQPQGAMGNPYRVEHGLEDQFVVQFSGRMGYSQSLETVLAAWGMLDDLPDIRLMMVGDGQAQPMVAKALRDDPRAVVLPVQPREKLPDLLNAADVGLAPLRHGMAGTSVPCKIFGIMAAANPVIASVDAGSDTEELIEASGAGIVVPPEDPAALAAAIRALYADRGKAKAMGASARSYLEAHHTQEVVIAQYEVMLKRVIAAHKGG